jgi:hypothetical protein
VSTDVDWRTEIDSSVEHLPDRPPAEYVAAGRRAVRRRRLVAAVVGGLTAVVVGVGWAATSGGPAHRSGPPIANDSQPSRSSGTEESRTDLPWDPRGAPARVSSDNELQIREGAIVHERRDDLYPGKDTDSVALDLTYKGKRWWVALEWGEGGATTSQSPAGEYQNSFDDFVADATAGGGMTSVPEDKNEERYPYAGIVNFTSTDGLVVRDGAEVVRRVDDPLGREPEGSSVGLVVEYAGKTTWMLLDTSHGGGSGTTEDAAESGWPTFDLWLADDVALQNGGHRLTLATFADDGTLRPGEDGVQILDQQANPDLPAYVGDTATASGVAMLRWRGETWFVLAVRFPHEDVITTAAASKADGADDIGSFIDVARDRADEGGFQ